MSKDKVSSGEKYDKRNNLVRMGKEIDSTEKAQRLGALGGKKSGEAKRKKKVFTETIKSILNQSITPGMAKMIQKNFGEVGVNLTIKDAMVYAQTAKAIQKQDTQAFNAIVDRVDGKPIQDTKLEHSGGVQTKIIRDDIK